MLKALATLSLLSLLATVGCAASTTEAEEEGGTTSNQTIDGSGTITLKNYLGHPKIKAIRAGVQAIDGMRLTKATNPGCDGTNEKFTDSSGQIRKLVGIGGEGDIETRVVVYFDERGRAIFSLQKEAEGTGGEALVTESRVYFDAASGRTLFQVVRQGVSSGLDATLQAKDEKPAAAQRVSSAAAFADPEAWFASDHCS